MDGDHFSVNLHDLLTNALPGFSPPPTARSVDIRDVCCDSRAALNNSLFVAVSGRNANGAAFAKEAVNRGAVAVISEDEIKLDEPVALIRVPDARLALARTASILTGLSAAQANGEFPAVGITGTNGKSTTAYLVRSILTSAGRVSALLGTIEYDLVSSKLASNLTTPDPVTLARHLMQARTAGAQAFVMEASSHSLDQRRTDGIRFAAAVFTNLTQDHLDYHASFDEYLLAKRRLFDNLDATATAVINADDPAAARMVEKCKARVIRFGIDQPADLHARIVRSDRTGTTFNVTYIGESLEFTTPMVGHHNVANCLAAAGACLGVGIDLATIRRGIASLKNVPGRLQRVDTADLGFDVFVDYAHTPDALRNVLTAVRPLTRGRLWCVFGCGGDRDRTKRPLMARAVAELADDFVITSDNPRTEDPLMIIQDIERGLGSDAHRPPVPDRAKAIAQAIDQLTPGDCLVIAGKGHEDYQIVGTTKHHFDDVEVAAAAIASREGRVHATAHSA